MSKLIRCDQCKIEMHDESDCYLMMERDGLDFLSHGEHPGPWHFCSWQCVSKFAEIKDRTRADGA